MSEVSIIEELFWIGSLSRSVSISDVFLQIVLYALCQRSPFCRVACKLTLFILHSEVALI